MNFSNSKTWWLFYWLLQVRNQLTAVGDESSGIDFFRDSNHESLFHSPGTLPCLLRCRAGNFRNTRRSGKAGCARTCWRRRHTFDVRQRRTARSPRELQAANVRQLHCSEILIHTCSVPFHSRARNSRNRRSELSHSARWSLRNMIRSQRTRVRRDHRGAGRSRGHCREATARPSPLEE